MGCSDSKFNVETLNQCKERKTLMKQSISASNAFAAHFAYAAALKNTGAALTDYASGEVQFSGDLPLAPPYQPPPSPVNNLTLPWDFFVMLMDDVCEYDGGGGDVTKCGGGYGGVAVTEKELPRSTIKGDVQNVNLLEVLTELDGCFLKASKSAYEVSKILEANKLFYHSNFANGRGHINHSTRVMRAITWNTSFKDPKISTDVKDNFASKEKDTHSTLLDEMLEWETKLYDQVKACEITKSEYQKKTISLNKLKKRYVSNNSLERMKATVDRLHTRYIVDMQDIDSTVLEINRLRDEQLYPKLVQLVNELGVMWENMRKQHDHQLMIMQALKNIKIWQPTNETSDHNLNNTQQLHLHVKIWCSEFEKLILHQKQYIKSLNNWLKLNLISTDNSSINTVSSPDKPQNPRIELLLRTWEEQLEKLPESDAKTAINNFAAVIDTIVQYRSDEMKMKSKCEEIRREIMKKSRKFEEWCDKQISKRTPSELMDVDVMDDMEVIVEQQTVVEELKRRLTEEEEAYRRWSIQVKDKSLKNLKTGLPEIFTALSEFAGACSLMYGNFKSLSMCRESN